MNKLKKYLKKNSKNIFLFVIVTSFTACGWIFEDTSISPVKPPLFRLGDTLIFESTYNIDSFYVKTAKLYEVNEDDGCVSDYLDRQRYFSLISQIDCNDSCYMFASTIMPEEYFAIALSFGSGFKDPIYPGGYRLGARRELKVGKYLLKGVNEIAQPKDSVCKRNVYSFLYSTKYGLVQYQLFNNEVFQITEESLEMLMARE